MTRYIEKDGKRVPEKGAGKSVGADTAGKPGAPSTKTGAKADKADAPSKAEK